MIKTEAMENTNVHLNRAVQALLSLVIISSCLLTGCSSLSIPWLSNSKTTGNGYYGVAQTERTLAQRLLDESIERTAKINMKNFDNGRLANISRIDVDSFDSFVLLTGEVASESDKLLVQQIIASMPDVVGVYNELTIGRPHSMSYNLHDGYITSRLMSKVLASNQLSTSQLDVVTENGLVYVMGRLTHAQQTHLINIANNSPEIMELVLLTKTLPDGNTLSQTSLLSK